MPRPRLDFRDPDTLKPFLDDRGRILSRRKTKLTAAEQRHLANQAKLARELALLPYPPNERPVEVKGITGKDGRPVAGRKPEPRGGHRRRPRVDRL